MKLNLAYTCNFLDASSHKNTIKVGENPSYQLRSLDSIKVSDNQAYIPHATNDDGSNMAYDYIVKSSLNTRDNGELEYITITNDDEISKSEKIYY